MQFHTLKSRPDLIGVIPKITKEIWTPALVDALICNPQWLALETTFPETQIIATNDQDEIVGIANTIPFHFQSNLKELPSTGWDWLLNKGLEDHRRGIAPNYLGGLQIGIKKSFQGQGFSAQMLKKAKEISQTMGFQNLLIPVRPSLKHQYQEEPMEVYLQRKTIDQFSFDPWLRTHEKAGADIVKICTQSMNVSKHRTEWQKTTSQIIPSAGVCILEGLLNPIVVDSETGIGVYIEPNVWVCH